jgi:hypothetical protein
MAAVHSHTVQKEARECESCHSNPQAMGYGIEGGKIFGDQTEDWNVGLKTADGRMIPMKFKIQKPKIDNFGIDWSRFVDENGTPLQTVDNHWNLAGALSNEQRSKLDRRGVCLSCHKDIPEGNLAVSAMTHIAEMAHVEIDNKEHQGILNKILNIGAWLQIVGGIFIVLFILYVLYKVVIRKKSIRSRNRGWK